MSPSISIQSGSISGEVASFAAERGASDYVVPVLEMTRRVFPNTSVTLRVQEDAEISEDRYIMVDVDTANLDVDQLVAAEQQWSAGLFDHCPSTHAHLFCLGTV